MTSMRLLLTSVLLAVTCGPAGAGVYGCNLQQYSTSVYLKEGRWDNTLERGDKKRELHVKLDEDGSNSATVEHVGFGYRAKAQWSEFLGNITVIERGEIGGVSVLTVFRDVEGKRPANYSIHNRFGYGAAAAYAGFCTSQ